MMRRLICLLALSLLALAPSAHAASGTAEITLAKRLSGKVVATQPATVASGKLTLPATQATVGETTATLRHNGVVQIRKVNLTALRTTLGAQSRTTAVSKGKRFTLFTYSGEATLTEDSATLTNARVTLTRKAAKKLGLKKGSAGRADVTVTTPKPVQGLTWRPRESFIRYINSEDGGTEVSGGAENGPAEVRPGSDASLVYSFLFPTGKGTLRFFWNARGIDISFTDPEVVDDTLVVTHAGERKAILALGAGEPRPATLTEAGAAIFQGFYNTGDEFGSVAVSSPGEGRRTRTAAIAAKRKAKRIVALSPFTANTLAQLGVIPVGIANTLGGQSSFGPKLKKVKRLELSHPNGPNLEQLAALEPDTVMSSPTWSRGHSAMRDLGMKVELADPTAVGNVDDMTRKVGAIVGKRKRAAKIARRQVKDIAAAQKGIKSHPRTLLILGVGRAPYAFLPDSWGGDMIIKAGADLLTDGMVSDGGFARISDEEVVARNPEVIIAVPHGNAKDIPSISEYLANNPSWQSTDAAKNDRVYIAKGNALLQAFTDVGKRIRDMQTMFLKNR